MGDYLMIYYALYIVLGTALCSVSWNRKHREESSLGVFFLIVHVWPLYLIALLIDCVGEVWSAEELYTNPVIKFVFMVLWAVAMFGLFN